MEELLEEVLEAKDLGISVLDKHHQDNNWSYGQSILFTVTVVTTIGKSFRSRRVEVVVKYKLSSTVLHAYFFPPRSPKLLGQKQLCAIYGLFA